MLTLNEMSRAEKLQLMETLWVDLSADANDLDSPDWHLTALHEAERAHRDGQADFIDWAEAKARLRDGRV